MTESSSILCRTYRPYINFLLAFDFSDVVSICSTKAVANDISGKNDFTVSYIILKVSKLLKLLTLWIVLWNIWIVLEVKLQILLELIWIRNFKKPGQEELKTVKVNLDVSLADIVKLKSAPVTSSELESSLISINVNPSSDTIEGDSLPAH